MSTIIIVLCMHRSGSSLLSSMIHTMGANMGELMLPPDEHNPLGYFEDQRMKELNKNILMKAGGTWDNPSNHKEIVKAGESLEALMWQYIEARESEARSKYCWGWKDPRTALTIEPIHNQLSSKGKLIKYVVLQRSKAAVVKSLETAHGLGQWSELYDLYHDRITHFLRRYHPLHVHFVRYEALVSDQELAWHEVGRLARFLGVVDPDTIEDTYNRIELRCENYALAMG